MSLFGVRKNGVPTYLGAMVVTTLQTVSHSTIGGNLVVVGDVTGGANLTAAAGGFVAFSGRTIMGSASDGKVSFQNNAASTYADILVKDVDFRQPASTFAQVATMTNGPRAANPVAWVEVMVAGSTGRMPVW